MKLRCFSPEEKARVVHRRRFEKDVRRLFVGQIEADERGMARTSGTVFVIDNVSKHRFVQRPDRRTELVPVAPGDVIANVPPEGVDLGRVGYEIKGRPPGSPTGPGGAWT